MYMYIHVTVVSAYARTDRTCTGCIKGIYLRVYLHLHVQLLHFLFFCNKSIFTFLRIKSDHCIGYTILAYSVLKQYNK